MRYRKIMIIIILAIFLLSIASTSASDVNDTAIASENNLEIDQSSYDVIGVGEDTNLAFFEENEILGADEKSFANLNTTINGNTDNNIYLNGNYKYSSSDDNFKKGIVINRDVNIYGNGAIIDGNNEARIFQINGGNVVFYNITFVNANAGDDWSDNGGAINGNCKAINCNFTANHALNGGAMYEGSAVNCTFTKNTAGSGGAIDGGSAMNCTFTENTASFDGGAMYGGSAAVNCTFTKNTAGSGGAIDGGSAMNCTFTENTASFDGGAMFGGCAVNCTFTNNTAYEFGGAMCFSYKMNCNGQNPEDYFETQNLELHWDANNFTTAYSSEEKLPILLKSQANNLIDFINYDAVIYKEGIKIKTYHCLSNDRISLDLPIGIYTAELIVTYPGIDKPEPKNITLTVTDGTTFSDLNKTINDNKNDAINLDKNYTFNSTFDSAFREGIVINRQLTINGNGYTIDAKGKAKVFNVQAEDVTIENLTIKNANYNGDGGAVYFAKSGRAINCNFINNTASAYGGAIYIEYYCTIKNCNFTDNDAYYGGAVWMYSGTVLNCNFVNNTASEWGGAVYFSNTGSVSNCNFTDNKASSSGGAVYFSKFGTVENCNFTDNKASSSGGAVYFSKFGTVENCNFTNNIATNGGGAVYFENTGNVTNCNFVNNTANSQYYGGGAIIFMGTGNVTDCNFTNNIATNSGGAIRFKDEGTVTNCNFVDNKATYDGGAIYFSSSGTVTNCNFTNNTASYGGAILFISTGNVTNCNFTDNTASDSGGAIVFMGAGNVTDCNFTDNNAPNGSAIYFYLKSTTKTVSNSRFLNNKANAEDLQVTKNDNNITIVFTGKDNLLNAIYSRNDDEVTFTNVIYWSANGIANTGSSAIKPSRSNREAGQNITVSVVVDDVIVLNKVITTDENGQIVLDISAGDNYYIGVRHDTDSYYTEAERTISTMKFNVNVTSQTTTNRTVNITTKSNIFSEVMPGKLLFILPNGTEINATYAADGIWWAVHTFDDYEDYQVNASYIGLSNVSINNATISITKTNSTVNISDIVLDYGDSRNVTVTAEGATSITAKINGNPVDVVDNYTIPISALAAGNYTLTVTTMPDEDHNPANKTVNITVNKVNSTLTVNNIEFDYNSSASTSVSFTGASGINASVINQPNATINVEGNTITLSNLNAGNYTLTVTTLPDENHTAVTKKANISVNNVNSTLTVNNVVLDYGETVNVTAITEGAEGITAKIDNQDVNVIGNIIPVLNLKAGNHTLTVTTIPDNNHLAVNKTVTITVNKIASTLNVSAVNLDYSETTNVTIITEGAEGITVKINTEELIVTKNSIPIPVLNAGCHNLTVTTVPDENHTATNKTVTITVNKVNSTLTLDNVILNYGESTNVSATTDGADGITAKIGDDDALVNENTIAIPLMDAGNYTLTVTTIPDNNHNSVTKTANISVSKVDSTLTVDNIVFDYNNTGSTPVSFTGATDINLSVIDQPDALVNVKDGEITVSNLNSGNYTLTVTTIPDNNHNAVTRNASITVSKIDSTLTVDSVVLHHGETTNVSVTTDGAIGITAKIGDEDVSVNGNTIIIPLLDAGNYTLTVTTIPDENHNAITKTANITIIPVADLAVTKTANGIEANVGEDFTYTITVTNNGPSKATNVIISDTLPDTLELQSATLNGEKIDFSGEYVIDSLDAASSKVIILTVKAIKSGLIENTVKVMADEEDPTPENNQANASININKIMPTLEVTLPEKATTLDSIDINIKMPADADKVTVKLDDVEIAVANFENGQANIKLDSLTAGAHTISVAYDGSDKYLPTTEMKDITVSKVLTHILISDETRYATDYNAGERGGNLTALLLDENNNTLAKMPVEFKINGVTYKLITDDEGAFAIQINLKSPKTYTNILTFNGDDIYNATSIKSQLTIVKKKTSIKASDKSFNAKSETKTIKVTLKTIKNVYDGKTYIKKGKKLTLIVKGKTYHAKINNKGVAKFIVKLSRKGKFTAKIKFAGDRVYKASNKKIKITIK